MKTRTYANSNNKNLFLKTYIYFKTIIYIAYFIDPRLIQIK